MGRVPEGEAAERERMTQAAPPHVFASLDELQSSVSAALGPTEWMLIDQARIEKFADATDDWQWIHIDRERAAEGPFGQTIAHGFLTLSLFSCFLPQLLKVGGIKMGINYGLDRVRFPTVVPSGSRVRARAVIHSATSVRAGDMRIVLKFTIEVEGFPKPACVADVIVLYRQAGFTRKG